MEASPNPLSAIFRWTATTDHKRIGLLYLWTTLLFFAIGGLEAMLIRLQLAIPDNKLLDPDVYNQIFTMHGTTMIFLVVMPVLIGFGNYFVPLMIGARDMAFPNMNALSYWLFLFGGLLLHFCFFTGGAPAAGWFSYAPLTEMAYNSSHGVDYWALALLVLGIGSVATGINIIVTILTMRAKGMTMRRLPLFVWMFFVTSFLILLAMPVLNASIVMLLIDRLLDAHYFLPSKGGSAMVWQHFFWMFGHPEVYILALPAFGMISEMIPVFSRKPIFGYTFVAGSSVVIAVLSFGVWAHHMFATGNTTGFNAFFSIATMLIAVPTGIKIFNWIATMWGGTIRFTTSMKFSAAFLVQFVIGGLTGVMFAVAPVDWQLTDSYFVVAHFHYVLFGGTFFAVLGAVYYWFPKMSGRMLSEKLGNWNFWLMVLGFNMTFMVQHFLGVMGMPRRVYTYTDMPGWAILNQISSLGAIFMFLGAATLMLNIFRSLCKGEKAGDNPWKAWTLEWATTSPPPVDNFNSLPPIRSRRPLWDTANPDRPDWLGHPEEAPEKPSRYNKAQLCSLMLIASEAAFFVALIASFIIFTMNRDAAGMQARAALDAMRTGGFTVLLILSSVTLHVAEGAAKTGDRKKLLIWLGATVLLGAAFLGGQAFEYRELLEKAITVNSSLFATAFFTLTGFHGFHVLMGLVALSIFLLPVIFKKRLLPANGLGAVALYWHFVDIVWIAVFILVYLKP